MSETIEAFFRQFEINSHLGDAEQSAKQFADSFMAADPSGARVVQAADLKTVIPKRKQLLESLGSRSTSLVSIHETELDNRYVLVKTQWRMEFDRGMDGAKEINLDSTYIVYKSAATLKIVFYLSHESLMTVLRVHGLLPAETP